MDLAAHAQAKRRVHELVTLQAAFAGECGANDRRFVVTLAVSLHVRLRAREILFDQCGDFAGIHLGGTGTRTKESSLADDRVEPNRHPRLSAARTILALRPEAAPLGADLRNVIVMLLLGAAAVASWFYSLPDPVAPARRSSGDDAPLGYYMRGAQLLLTDEDGHVAYRILADRLEEQPGQERLLLERVQIEYQPANEVPWVITAGAGSAPKDASLLDLTGGVEIRSEPTDGSRPYHIKNESLRFESYNSSVTSDALTEMRVGDWQLVGKGLRANLKDERLALESEIHGNLAR